MIVALIQNVAVSPLMPQRKFIFVSEKALSISLIVTIALMLFQLYLVFFWVPSDAAQGVVQRMFYFHLSVAWVSFLGFLVALVTSIFYLSKRDLVYDQMSFAFIFTAWIFANGILITGPLWAKPIWNKFWDWTDIRLMSLFCMWAVYSSYLIIRLAISDIELRARLSSVFAIIGAALLVLVYFSIRIWKTNSHPGPVVGIDKAGGLADPRMHYMVWYSFFSYTALGFCIVNIVYNYLVLKTNYLKSLYENNND